MTPGELKEKAYAIFFNRELSDKLAAYALYKLISEYVAARQPLTTVPLSPAPEPEPTEER